MKIINTLLFLTCLFYAQSLLAQEFKLCGDQKTYPYYNPKLKYEGDFYEVKAQIRKGLNQDLLDKKMNGILTIQFHVNCEGQSGNFTIRQTDLNYLETVLDEKFTNHILQLVKKLNGWKPAKNEKSEFVNSHKFISFRIINGEVLEIFPN